MEKSYRIHTNIIEDTVLNVNMQQDYDFLEVLSLKLRTIDAYRLHSSNYGVIIGRVLANDAFGIPNARISVFIEKDGNDPTYMESIYPYTEIMDADKDGRRYNLLPDYRDNDCYRIVGTFPNKRLVLDDNVELEIFEKYYKFTTVTNSAGDYMIFGVPSGSQQIHVDMDLSDIGILSQTPRDFEYKGYSMTMFDSPSQFKESTNLDGLAQIFSQNKSVFVYPFWNDANLNNGIGAITRCDVQIQYKFEPTCVFMGAIISDNEGNSIGHKCAANIDNGMNDQLITGEGTIEMIRKTTDGLVEEYSIQGNQLIDANGVWCYQIPMNLDYVGTDEYGNIIPTDNPNKGIPTRTQVRFRFSKNETGDEGHSRHTAKYLVPMNPALKGSPPRTVESGEYIERMYTFGSATPDDCFRDLYWNNVYSVKNYIPKLQVAHRAYAKNYTGLKGSNLAKDQNPVPFNKLRIDIPIRYVILCILFRIVVLIVQVVNSIMSLIYYLINEFCISFKILGKRISICPLAPLKWVFNEVGLKFTCISVGGGLSNDNTAYYPSCSRRAMAASSCPSDMENCRKSSSQSELMDLAEQRLAEDLKIIKLDFYQDWLNGSLYMPLWYWRKRKKKKFLFFTISGAKNDFCDCDRRYSRLKSFVTCNIEYINKKLGVNDASLPEGEDNWHRSRNRSGRIFVPNGLIKGVENKDGLTAYYYVGMQPTSFAGDVPMKKRPSGFYAFREFATDIILLGNLNENNLYGLPQFFKSLPSTTANIPPIASVTEASDNNDNYIDTENTLADSEETGPSLVTGMDWIDGNGIPAYSDGLFMLLTCTHAHTKAKSCINVERLSELGMNLDMTYSTQYPTKSGLGIGTFEHDGFITKYELDDTENRAMFATMNHLGFVPQPFQKAHDLYETQVLDEGTNYYIPKFKYLYPTDLDGRMAPLVERYRNGFQQVLSDDKDSDYVNFRLGDNNGRDGQFYISVRNSMPLYNNSFYFYFGVNKGNTAIEKFNKMFNSQCFQNKKEPFTLDVITRSSSFCKELYKDDQGTGMVKFTSDDIQGPYSYTLVDVNDIEVDAGDEINDSSFEIHDLANGQYTLTVTDINGRSIDERITLAVDPISLDFETRGLGQKYYETVDDASQKSVICNNAYDIFGKITFTKIYLDGYEFEIGSGTTFAGSFTNPSKLWVKVYAKTIVNDQVDNTTIFDENAITSGNSGSYVADLYLYLNQTSEEEETETMEECLCSSPTFFTAETIDESDTSDDPKKIFTFGFRVFKPREYTINIIQNCKGIQVSSNATTMVAMVQNGSNFYAYLNNVPIKFMLDKGNDFYPQSNNSSFIARTSPWFRVHDENAYKFPTYDDTNLDVWKDFLTLTDDMLSSNNKKAIVKYKFKNLYNMAKAIYVASDTSKLTYTATGGVQPLLYRTFAPKYSDEENSTTQFLFSDNNYVSLNTKFPTIVGNNYVDGKRTTEDKPRINGLLRDAEHTGNYFMVATNNGRYTGKYGGDCNIYSLSIPENSPVNITDEWKKLGEDTTMIYIPRILYNGGLDLCYKQSKPYFRAMFVDRRLDYDLCVLGSIVTASNSITYSISSEAENDEFKRKTLEARILGTIYNGIEMAYDDNYNIISAVISNDDTSEVKNPSAETVSADTTLEYTYRYEKGATNVVETILNPSADTYVWKNYGDDLTKLICTSALTPSEDVYTGGTNTPILKTYYTATILGYDVRQLMWSNDNKRILNKVVNSRINSWDRTEGHLPFYLYSANANSYNGQFATNNYPTRRFINIGGLGRHPSMEFNITSCSYDLSLEENETTNVLESVMSEGGNIDVYLEYGCLIPSPRGNQEDYGHFLYEVSSTSGATTIGGNMPLSKIMLGVNYKQVSNDGFACHSTTPRLLSVDDVRTLKGKSTITQMEEFWKNRVMLGNCMVNKGMEIMLENKWSEYDQLFDEYPYWRQDGTEYYYLGGDILDSDDENLFDLRICSTWFERTGNSDWDVWTYRQTEGISPSAFNFGKNKFLCACAMRNLFPTNGDNLTRSIKLFDFSEFYDCRNIHADCTRDTENPNHYIVTIYNDSENEAIRPENITHIGVNCERTSYLFIFWPMDSNEFMNEEDNFTGTGHEIRKSMNNGNLVIDIYQWELVANSLPFTVISESIVVYATATNGIIYKLKFNFDLS